jgi:hypothetical protein
VRTCGELLREVLLRGHAGRSGGEHVGADGEHVGLAHIYGRVWCGMVWYGMVWHGMVWHGMAWHGPGWCGMGREVKGAPPPYYQRAHQ